MLFLKRMLAAWNRSEREKINENWTDIERGFSAANTAINTAQETAEDGVTRAKNAQATADNATKIANGIDGKATEALNKSNQAVSTSDVARDTAQQAKVTAEATAKQINDVIKETGDTNAEVIAARTDTNTSETTPTIGKRMDNINHKIRNVLNLKGYELSSSARTANKGGIVVFESDDARNGDWDNLYPIFKEVGIPITLAVIARNIGWPGFMTETQLRTVYDEEGWEIASHSWTHPGDIRLMSDSEIMQEYKDSRDRLIELGFDCQTYSVPNGRFNTRERIEAKKWYRAARCSAAGEHNGINYSPLETHELKTVWLDESYATYNDAQSYKDLIDRAVATGGLLIISTHGYLVTTPEYKALVKEVAEYARDNARVMTLKDALDEMGNIVDVGDYTRTFTDDVDKAPSGQHFVVGFDGTVASTINDDLVGLEQQVEQQRKDDYKKYVETVSGGTNTVIYDDKGNPSVMVAIPRFNLSDVIDGAPDTPHPAFIVRGEVKDVIYVSKYLNSVIDGRAVSLPNVAPKTNITYGTAQMFCADKGTGWHLMTAAEWAAIALWSKKNGTLPNGNNNYGKDINKPFQRAIEATKDGDNTATTLTGTGHVSWTHDGTVDGIYDLNGTVNEWIDGLKIVDGRIVHAENNNFYPLSRENEWIESDDYFDNYQDKGTLVINNARNHALTAQQAFSNIIAADGHTPSEMLKTLAIMPHDDSSIDDLVYANLNGERMAIRGGNYAGGNYAGIFTLNFSQQRTAQVHSIGFRSVYIQ